MNTPLTFKQTFLGSLIAGAGAAIANNVWHLIHSDATTPAMINAGSVSGAKSFP